MNGFTHHRFRVQDPVGTALSTELPPYQYHKVEHVWKVGKDYPCCVSCVFQCDISHQHSDRSAPCLYNVTWWGVMSCVCGMAFLSGSTLVKVHLIQAGTVDVSDGVGCHLLCLYTVTGWGVVSCVCGMAFLSGSTLVKVPLLQAGTVAI